MTSFPIYPVRQVEKKEKNVSILETFLKKTHLLTSMSIMSSFKPACLQNEERKETFLKFLRLKKNTLRAHQSLQATIEKKETFRNEMFLN